MRCTNGLIYFTLLYFTSLSWLFRGRINGGGDINSLGLLPDKLKTELALHVNLETLRKVGLLSLHLYFLDELLR